MISGKERKRDREKGRATPDGARERGIHAGRREERVSTAMGKREGAREGGSARQGLGQAVLDSAQLPRTEV